MSLSSTPFGGSNLLGRLRRALSRNRLLVAVAMLAAFLAGVGVGRATSTLSSSQEAAAGAAGRSGVFLRAPYLMQPRPDGIIIAWLTPNSVIDGSLRYGPPGHLGGPLSSRRLPQPDGTLQSVQLSGLTPRTAYDYQVQAAGQTVRGRFITLPGDATIRFATVGDFGGGSAAEEAVVRLMLRQDPDLFITLGDNAYERGTLEEIDANVFHQYGAFLARYGAVWVMGNHDHTTDRGLPTLQNFFMPGRNYSFDAGDIHFTILEADGSQGYAPGQAYYTFLEQDLAGHASARWKLVFFHYPAYSCGLHGSTSWVDRYWVPLFDKYGVDAVFNGHDHDYERVKADTAGVHYFVAGMGGKSHDPVRHDCVFQQKASANFFGDLLVTIDGSTIRVDAVTVDGTVFDSVAWSKPAA
jgi:predicted phosphodiesterase